MLGILFIVLIIGIGISLFLNSERFGKHPSKNRLKKIQQSPNYKNGSFQNLNHTPALSEDTSMIKVLFDFIFKSKPESPKFIPSIKTELKSICSNDNVLIWMGHSSYFMQIDGKKILVDPVFCGYASPFSFSIKAFNNTDLYTADDIPEIDYLFLSHDHWDHMDHKTLKQLKPKTKRVITGLGNGAHLEYWGFEPKKIIEGDWYDTIQLDLDFKVIITPTRHFSGRGFKRNQTLWVSFVFKTPSLNVFIGGDSGYDTYFKDIGDKFGPFNLVILENGQYDEQWKYIHMLPGEQLKAASNLNAETLLPVHFGKFTLANHDWDDPLINISKNKSQQDIRVITPMIGEQVNLNDSLQQFKNWWKLKE